MQGVLKEAVQVNGTVIEKGTAVYIDIVQAQTFDIMSPAEEIIVSVAYKYFTLRTLIQKSKIKLAA